jgi:hypothetical protein
MFVAIEEFDQRALDVVIPLVPGFEREIFKAALGFPLRHLSADHSALAFECKVLKASLGLLLWKNPPICG